MHRRSAFLDNGSDVKQKIDKAFIIHAYKPHTTSLVFQVAMSVIVMSSNLKRYSNISEHINIELGGEWNDFKHIPQARNTIPLHFDIFANVTHLYIWRKKIKLNNHAFADGNRMPWRFKTLPSWVKKIQCEHDVLCLNINKLHG